MRSLHGTRKIKRFKLVLVQLQKLPVMQRRKIMKEFMLNKKRLIMFQ